MSSSWKQKAVPFENYSLSGNNAEIHRLTERIEQIEKMAASGDTGWTFEGGEVVINKEVNRLQILYDNRPDSTMISLLKSKGFKWAPSQNAWQRQLTPNAMYAAKQLTGHAEAKGKNDRRER